MNPHPACFTAAQLSILLLISIAQTCWDSHCQLLVCGFTKINWRKSWRIRTLNFNVEWEKKRQRFENGPVEVFWNDVKQAHSQNPAEFKSICRKSESTFRHRSVNDSLLDCSSCCQRWHNQLLGLGGNYFFSHSQVGLDTDKWNHHLKTAFCIYCSHRHKGIPGLYVWLEWSWHAIC